MEELSSRILDLPPELRRMIYVELGILVDQPLSLFALAAPPDAINRVKGSLREELLDIYFGENTFVGGNAIGLGPLLHKAKPDYLRRIRRLRLQRQVWTCSLRAPRVCLYPQCSCGTRLIVRSNTCQHSEKWMCATITCLRGDPWYVVEVEPCIQDDVLVVEVRDALEEHLAVRMRINREGYGALDSLEDLTEVWREAIKSVYERREPQPTSQSSEAAG